MANPVKIDIVKDTWVLVASGVMTGQIINDKTNTSYLATYRTAGDPAPTDLLDSRQIFEKSNAVAIKNTVVIDVYVYCKEKDGRVLVDV